MKEIRFFYAPDVAADAELPADEAAHCLRVLRLQAGDEIRLTDGKGMFYKAEITTATGKRCLFKVLEAVSHPKEWSGHLHLALAPTKNMDRIEWLAEKATEIGFDELTFLDCRYSERKVVKTERIDKILVSAMKQSHKARKPLLNEMEDFKRFVARPFAGQKFIAHCMTKPMWPVWPRRPKTRPWTVESLSCWTNWMPDRMLWCWWGRKGILASTRCGWRRLTVSVP